MGDSTVVDQESAPYSGWGQHLPPHFKLGLSVANYGDSGESSGSALAKSSLFPTVRSRIRAGDYVFVQMGHNDGKTDKATYQSNLGAMVDQTRGAAASRCWSPSRSGDTSPAPPTSLPPAASA